MKQSSLIKIKETLKEEKINIMRRQAQAEEIDFSGDEVDAIQGKIIANVQSQLSARELQKLKFIDEALTKIDEGTFGICEECGEDIAEKRLMINPVFANCVGCSEQLEAESKRYSKN